LASLRSAIIVQRVNYDMFFFLDTPHSTPSKPAKLSAVVEDSRLLTEQSSLEAEEQQPEVVCC